EVGIRPLLLASLADVLAARDERTEAIRLLYKVLAEVPAQDPRTLSDHAHAMLGLLLAEAGETSAAAAVLSQAPVSHPAALIARALLSAPEHGTARVQLEAAVDAARGCRPLAAHARAHLACALALEGDMSRARNLAAELGRKSRYPLAPWDEAILARISRHGESRASAEAAVSPPQHMVLRFFGGPTATIGDIHVGKDGWRYMEARALFWYALAHGKRGFSRDDLALDLFPELDGEQAGKALRNTFYALRKMFRKWGIAQTLPMKDGRGVLLPGDLCPSFDSDLDRLHACIKSAQAGEHQPAAELLSLLEHPFMADLEGDWPAPFRSYWNGEAIRALQLAATAAEQGGRPQEALLLLRRQAEFNPDDPALARRILLLAHAMADIGALRATYLEHCRVTRDELGVEPDRSVVALYAKLTHS
ncbi:MAG: AfsR/SARP family transcriptional regulator, partial [Chloroflexota bacterium]